MPQSNPGNGYTLFEELKAQEESGLLRIPADFFGDTPLPYELETAGYVDLLKPDDFDTEPWIDPSATRPIYTIAITISDCGECD